MLDVHPPEHTPHSWRDFFIHIATIVVGLVIAVGLEQAVELAHRHHQRAELRQSLDVDSAKTVFDCRNAQASLQSGVQWLGERISEVRAVLYTHRALAAWQTSHEKDFDEPEDPVWKAAKANGLVNLLSEQEIQAYSENDNLVDQTEVAHQKYFLTGRDLEQFYLHFPVGPDGGTPDLSSMTPAQVGQYLDLLTAEYLAYREFLSWDENLLGAEEAVLGGERNLDRIEHNERKYDHPQPLPGNLSPIR